MNSTDIKIRIMRAIRCVQLHRCFTTSYKKHPTNCVWLKMMQILKEDLSVAQFFFNELLSYKNGNDLTSQEFEYLICSEKINTYVEGLQECIRVLRLIIASVGDILCLDLDVDFDATNWRQEWKNLLILEDAIEIEQMWNNIESSMQNIGISYRRKPMMTIPEIRKRALSLMAHTVETEEELDVQKLTKLNLCDLTLQPLDEKFNNNYQSIKSVEWEGKTFFACSANFWANKVSSNVP